MSYGKTSVFVSYDYDNDREYKNLIIAWDKNDEFNFEVYDESVDVSVDSNDASSIRRVISRRIKKSDVFLCLVGNSTYKSEWVEWEIEKADELDKEFAAVKIEKGNDTPDALYGKNAEWAYTFNFERVKESINNAQKSGGYSFLEIATGLGGLWLLKELLSG
ncbi:TIR domain-containing protein [Salinibacter altiplanensis]|uniref:TIR domain-containing protein n=1 Tax=Salinibacter altiplanensis TaxID=1803181 RepID=UPI000C9EDF2D|nr:TIR domain-containing protein [Salinibacter altiplanensis]